MNRLMHFRHMRAALVVFLSIFLVMNVSMAAGATITKSDYGTTADGKSVGEYTLANANGMEVKIVTYGGIVTSLKVPDRNGAWGNVVLGFDKLSDYETKNPYFGALIGRYGNRIGNATFKLDGHTYTSRPITAQTHCMAE